MIQWCRGDQFHTSAWILWWYNGVKVTSSIPVNGYYDDTMVYRWPVPYQWMDIMMIQWCIGDQFHTSAWILWWYNLVKVTSSIIHALVWNWSPLHHCIIIISIHWYWTGHLYTIVDIVMTQWCKGDQFNTSEWILWWHNGVKVTSSIPVNGYYDDTMV